MHRKVLLAMKYLGRYLTIFGFGIIVGISIYQMFEVVTPIIMLGFTIMCAGSIIRLQNSDKLRQGYAFTTINLSKLPLPYNMLMWHTVIVLLMYCSVLHLYYFKGEHSDAHSAWDMMFLLDAPSSILSYFILYISYDCCLSAVFPKVLFKIHAPFIILILIGGLQYWLIGKLILYISKKEYYDCKCDKCQYDLTGTVLANRRVCPECGTPIYKDTVKMIKMKNKSITQSQNVEQDTTRHDR